jgi:hypothetical protein
MIFSMFAMWLDNLARQSLGVWRAPKWRKPGAILAQAIE